MGVLTGSLRENKARLDFGGGGGGRSEGQNSSVAFRNSSSPPPPPLCKKEARAGAWEGLARCHGSLWRDPDAVLPSPSSF